MPKKKAENELTPEDQFKRFREKAKELGIDDKDKPLEEAFERLTGTSDTQRRTSKIKLESQGGA